MRRERNQLRFRYLKKMALTIFICFMGAGCTTSPTTEDEIALPKEVYQAKGKFKKEYIIAPGDSIEISVWRVPEVSRVVIVRPDGFISLPTVRQVQASGKSFTELEDELTLRFSERLNDPNVTAIAVKVRENMVFVVGDVNMPRAIPLHEARTVMEAVTFAGGAKRSGQVDNVSIIRLGEDGIMRAIPIVTSDDGQPSPYLAMSVAQLQPDDIIFVPETGRSEVLRFLDDFVGRPLQYVNILGNTVLSYRIIDDNF
ncbi:MAG: polysaccharide export outer membrane protein [Glaciecola sp.]|jgi:polysaccharide export outer membrane protein